MRLVLCVFCFVAFHLVGYNQESIRFEELNKSLGDMKAGDVREVAFVYRNIGTEAVRLVEVITQCGCTIASFEKQDSLPGDEASLVLSFDSKGKLGLQRKTVTVLLSNGERYVLVITANVLP